MIVTRESTEEWENFLQEKKISTLFSFPCSGTASIKLLSQLGLENTEKTLIFCTVPHERRKRLLSRCVMDMGINLPGKGIALLVPYESVGGLTSLNILLGSQKFDPNEVMEMENTNFPYALVIAVAESGFSDEVMDAARSAGAGGGTVIHAKGTAGDQERRKFLGVNLATEKDMVLIVVNQKNRKEVMQAIMDKAGIKSPAHTILFSLPVEDVAGLKSIVDETEDE